MTEFIVRLTDEQEATIRRWHTGAMTLADAGELRVVAGAMLDQARDALALYDQLVTEAQAASDE